MGPKQIYVITLNWNTTDLLRNMADSVEATTEQPHEWIVVDNGSDAANWRGLERWAIAHGRVGGVARLHRYEENQGLIVGHNQALDMAALDGQPHEVVLIDTDVEIHEAGWLDRVLGWANDRPEVGVIGLEHGTREVCSPAIFLDSSGNWYIYANQTGVGEPHEGESAGLGFALIRWPVLRAGLRFDTAYRMYYKQDDDFCFQVRADLGLEVWAYPVANTHYGSASLKQVGYVVPGCSEGKGQWDEMKSENQAHFAEKWAWALQGRRGSLEGEAAHLRAMKDVMAERRE